MALTRITKGVIKPNENYDTHDINSTGIITAIGGNITGNLTVGGVLTYEDVSSIDAVGIITANQGIHVGAGISAVGVGTFSGLDISGDIDVDGHTNLDNVSIAGVTTASDNVIIPDNKKLVLGSLSGRQLHLYHNTSGSSNHVIESTSSSNHFILKATTINPRADTFSFRNHAHNKNVFRVLADTSTTLYYNGNTKLTTENTGVNITGIVTATSADINGDLDVDGHTNLDNVSIAGVTTFSSDLNVAENIIHTGDTDTKIRFADAGNIIQLQAGGTTRIQTNNIGARIDTTLLLYGDAGNPGRLRLQEGGALSEIMVARNSDTNSFLYFKTEISGTTATRVMIDESGHFRPNVDSTNDLGITGTRWRNVYADTYYGDGSNLTGITGTTINNNAANKVIMGSNTANTLEAVAKSSLFSQINHGQSFLDDNYLIFGDASDLQLVHQSSGAKARIRNTNDSGSLDIESTLTRFLNKDGSTEKLRIDSSGRVLIGTTTEGFAEADDLTINSADHGGITIRTPTNKEGNIAFSDTTSGTGEYSGLIRYRHSQNDLGLWTDSNLRLLIDSSGRVLIGTTTEGHAAGDNLTVADSGNAGITIRSGSSSNGVVYFSDGTSGSAEYRGAVQYNHTDNYLRFYTNGEEKLRITSGGTVNIGGDYTNTTGKLKVTGVVTVDGGFNLTAGTMTAPGGFSISSGNVIISGDIAHDADSDTTFGFGSGADTFRVQTAGSERLRISSDGTSHFYGNQTSTPEGDFGFRWDRNTYANFQLTNTNNTSVNAGARITLKTNAGNIAGTYYNNGGFYLVNSANGYLNYYANSVLRVNIDVNGHVSINPDNANGIPTSNGNVGKKFGIKSTANNVITGETTSSSEHTGLIFEARQTGRSGNARIAQINMGNDAGADGRIKFQTAPDGADVQNRLWISNNGIRAYASVVDTSYHANPDPFGDGSGIVYYRLNDNFHDSGIFAQHGTSRQGGDPTFAFQNSSGERCWNNPSDGAINIPNLKNSYPFSMAAWVNISTWPTSSNNDLIMNLSIGGQRVSLCIVKWADRSTSDWSIMYGGANHHVFPASSRPTNEWIHVVYSVVASDNTSHAVYQNGSALSDINKGAAHGGSAGWAIGGNAANSERFSMGRIGSIRFFNKAISSSEASALYTNDKFYT